MIPSASFSVDFTLPRMVKRWRGRRFCFRFHPLWRLARDKPRDVTIHPADGSTPIRFRAWIEPFDVLR